MGNIKNQVKYFIKYSAHMIILCILILQWFLAHYAINLKPFLGYLPSMVHRQYFIIILFEKSAQYTQENMVSREDFYLEGLVVEHNLKQPYGRINNSMV